VQRGGEVLGPGGPERLLQFIDARDLAGWTLLALEQGVSGRFNAAGSATALGELLADAEVTWVSDEFLIGEGEQPFVGVPLWIPANQGQRIDSSRAEAAGLRSRPWRETWRDTLEWALKRTAAPATQDSGGRVRAPSAGLSA